jgi:hypothetical protein
MRKEWHFRHSLRIKQENSMKFSFLTTIAFVLFTGVASAQTVADKLAPLSNDRIADQHMVTIGDTAVLAFVPFEDVKMDFSAICSGYCKFTFAVDDGLLTLVGVERRNTSNSFVIEGELFKEVAVTANSIVEFNHELRSDLRMYPKELVLEKPGS